MKRWRADDHAETWRGNDHAETWRGDDQLRSGEVEMWRGR